MIIDQRNGTYDDLIPGFKVKLIETLSVFDESGNEITNLYGKYIRVLYEREKNDYISSKLISNPNSGR